MSTPASTAAATSTGPSTTNARSAARSSRRRASRARRWTRGLRAESGRTVTGGNRRGTSPAPAWRSGGGRSLDGLRGHLHQGGERPGIGDRQIGEDLAVHLDACLLQTVDEPAVADAVDAAGRVDASDPQLAELALARPAIAVRVLQRVHDLLVGRTVRTALVAVVPLGPLERGPAVLLRMDG